MAVNPQTILPLPEALARLTTGLIAPPEATADAPQIEEVLGILHQNIKDFADNAFQILRAAKAGEAGGERNLVVFGPYLGRTILELAFTAALGRLDPIRVITLANYQQLVDEKQLGVRNMLAIQWSGDLIARKEMKSPEPAKTDTQAMTPSSGSASNEQAKPSKGFDWAKNISPEKIVRALLGGHLSEHCVNESLAYIRKDSGSAGQGILDHLLALPDTSVIPYLAARADALFSFLSKGVHAELLVPRSMHFDVPTVTVKLVETLKLSADMGLICSYVPFAYCKIAAAERISLLDQVLSEVESL